MAIDNEELMQKFVRTGMIMRHIEGEGPFGKGCGHKHDAHGHAGHGGKGAEKACCHGHHGEGEGRFALEHGGAHEEGPHAHGFEGDGHGEHHTGKRCGKKRHGQQRVIAMVSMKEGITQKDLAFLLGIRPQTLGEMLRRLEERGLVERKKSEADGRAIEVHLTDEGRARAEEIAERRKLAAADMFAVLSEGEKEQLVAILDKLAAELDKRNPHRHHHVEEVQG